MSSIDLIMEHVLQALLLERSQLPKGKGSKQRVVVMPPTGVWVKWTKGNPRQYHDGARHTGPGEEMLAWELGGATQGLSVSYDIVDGEGRKWEVKEPDSGNGIRPGIEGRKALVPIRRTLEEVCRQLSEGFDLIDFEALKMFAEGAPIGVSEVASFIENDVPMIMAGEISAGRILGSKTNPVGLLQVLEFVRFMIGDAVKAPPRKMKLGKLTKTIDVGTYVHANRALGLSDDQIDASVQELFAGTFRHPAFRKPQAFIREVWQNGITASSVFHGVEGVIVVNPREFMIIPRSELDVHFRFQRISKGDPRFVLVDN